MTIMTMKPRSQHEPMLNRIPYGIAMVALAASSLMCTHESKAPIDQIGVNQLNMNVQPEGQPNKLEWPAKMKLLSFNSPCSGRLLPMSKAVYELVLALLLSHIL